MVHLENPLDPLKANLSTTVDAFTPEAHDLSLSSMLGKRRLFRHRIWPESADRHDQPRRVRFFPGWLGKLPSGRVCMITNDVIPAGLGLEAYIEQVQIRH